MKFKCLCLLLVALPSTLAFSKDKGFKHDVEAREDETGEMFELHSKGTLANAVELDIVPGLKVNEEVAR